MKYLCFVLISLAFSVRAAEPSAHPSPLLIEQYRQLQERVQVIEGFRMVRMMDVEQLWKAVNDSLRLHHGLRQKLTDEVAALRDSLAGLDHRLEAAKQREATLAASVQSITILGMEFDKGFYRLLSLGIILALLLVIGALLALGRLNMKAVKETRSMYQELCHEFDRYRHDAVERQIKLSRELQNYRNLQEQLKSA